MSKIILIIFLIACTLHAEELNVKVGIKGNPARDYVAIGINGPTLSLALPASKANSKISFKVDQIESFKIIPPPSYLEAQEAMAAGEYEKAEKLLEPLSALLFSYFDLPGSNASQLVMTYAESLRLNKKFQLDADLLEKMIKTCKEPVLQQAKLASVGALISLGKSEEAEAQLKALPTLARTDPGFPFDKMARGRVFLLQKKHKMALDQIAQVIVYYRLDETWYPEAQLLMAEAYAGIIDELKSQAVEKEKATGKKLVLNKEIATYEKAQLSIYSDLVNFFPKSPWATAALARAPQLKEQPKPSESDAASTQGSVKGTHESKSSSEKNVESIFGVKKDKSKNEPKDEMK